jgi:hypothetical protein
VTAAERDGPHQVALAVYQPSGARGQGRKPPVCTISFEDYPNRTSALCRAAVLRAWLADGRDGVVSVSPAVVPTLGAVPLHARQPSLFTPEALPVQRRPR